MRYVGPLQMLHSALVRTAVRTMSGRVRSGACTLRKPDRGKLRPISCRPRPSLAARHERPCAMSQLDNAATIIIEGESTLTNEGEGEVLRL